MLTTIALPAVLGFVLGLWLRMFGLLAMTFAVAAATWIYGLPVLDVVLAVAAFQLAAFAAMAVRHRNKRKVAEFGLPAEKPPVTNDRSAVLR